MKINFDLEDEVFEEVTFKTLSEGEYLFEIVEFEEVSTKDGAYKMLRGNFKEVTTGTKVYEYFCINHPGTGGKTAKKKLKLVFNITNVKTNDTDDLIGKNVRAYNIKQNGYNKIRNFIKPETEQPVEELTEEDLPF